MQINKALLSNVQQWTRTLLLVALVLTLYRPVLQSQSTAIKTIDKTFTAKELVRISHRYGPLTVLPATDGKVKITGKLFGEAADAADLETLKEHFELEPVESGNTLEVTTYFKVRNWNTRNGVTRLEFQDGTRISRLKDLKIEATVYVPAGSKLAVSNKYDEIRIPEGSQNDLTVKIHSGRISIGDVEGRLDMEAKYSKGSIGNFKDAKLDLYDSDLQFGNGNNVELESKYSGLTMGSFNDLTASTYDDNISWKTVKGQLTLSDKYSEFAIGRFNQAKMDIYDADLVSEGGNELLVKSKYSKFKLKEVGQLSFENSYDDQVEVQRLGSLSADSKYTKFLIEKLRSKIYLRSYDDELQVGELLGPLEGIDFEGKYTDVTIQLPDTAEFQMEANLTYGHLNYPEDRLQSQFYKEKNDRLEFRASTKGANDNSPKISIVSYDGKITIE